MYFIDRLALRAGNEKGEDEADTVGCCSLRYEHVTLEPPNIIKFDFLGKDSMRFQQEVTVEPQVFKNVKLFKKEPKTIGDDLFDRLNVSGRRRAVDIEIVALTNLDWWSESASPRSDAWSICQGLPYLQCFLDLPAAAGEYAQGRHSGREDRSVQYCQPNGRYPM